MLGLVCSKHILLLAPTIIREYGLSIYWKCVLAVVMHKNTTFLGIISSVKELKM